MTTCEDSFPTHFKWYDHIDNTAEWRYTDLPLETKQKFQAKYAQDRIWLERGHV